jgi:hypothetical protein
LTDSQVGGLLTRASAGVLVSTVRYIAGGGGGGSFAAGYANGGNGGGGRGGSNAAGPIAGTAYSGGGGGGGNGTGAAGGSGTIIISYADSIPAATVTGAETPIVSGGYRTYTWNSSGSIKFN